MSKIIMLTQDKFTIVDDEVYDFLSQWKWSYHHSGYAVRTSKKADSTKREEVRMHRFIYEYYFGSISDGMLVDHINMDKLDNKIDNLRIATKQQNNCNKSIQSNNMSSKYKGVTKKDRKFIAQIKSNHKQINIGAFNNEDAAGWAYNYKAIELHGEFARLNSIPVFMSKEDIKDYKLTHDSRGKNKYKGVLKKAKKYVVQLYDLDGKHIYLGSHDSEQEALKARDRYLASHPHLLNKYSIGK